CSSTRRRIPCAWTARRRRPRSWSNRCSSALPARLDAAGLVAEATEGTGLEDFGEPTWREGLDRLVEALDAEARLNDLRGQIVTGAVVAELDNIPPDTEH